MLLTNMLNQVGAFMLEHETVPVGHTSTYKARSSPTVALATLPLDETE